MMTKIKEKVIPDPAKRKSAKAAEHTTGAGDHAARYVDHGFMATFILTVSRDAVPDSTKSAPQAAADKTSRFKDRLKMRLVVHNRTSRRSLPQHTADC